MHINTYYHYVVYVSNQNSKMNVLCVNERVES